MQTLNDGKEGFRQASENVKDADLKELFSKFSLQRSKFAGELEAELLTLGEEDPQDEGTTPIRQASSRLDRHQVGALTKADRHAVLAEAERGEDVAKKAYARMRSKPICPRPCASLISAKQSNRSDSRPIMQGPRSPRCLREKVISSLTDLKTRRVYTAGFR